MANFDQNIDHLCDDYNQFAVRKPVPVIEGIQYSVVTDLEVEPVDLPFFKLHARIDFNLDDNLCISYIKAARQELEQWSQLSFGAKEIELSALRLPKTYKLMFGPVDKLTSTTDHTLFAGYLKGGGEEVTVTFTTKWEPLPENIKIAICRYATGLYAIREHIVSDSKGNPVSGESLVNEAKEMIRPLMNVIWPI